MTTKITLVLGTARDGRQSEKIFKHVAQLLEEHADVELTQVDVREYLLAYTEEENDKSADWARIADASDAFILVIPEYNRNMPGELKLLWDSAYDEYEKKPVGLITVSSGQFGGVRMLGSLMQMCNACSMYVATNTIAVPKVKDFGDNEQWFDDSTSNLVEELIQLTHIKK